MSNQLSLGMALKVARTIKRLGVSDVAKLAGISRSSVWRIERGDLGVKLSSCIALAEALGIALHFEFNEKKGQEK
jgi:transcriptional regulator with XRE-family HTH domain